MAGGTTFFEQCVFLVHIFIGLCMAVGYHTSLMTCLTWFMTVSLHARNILVLHGGDILMRMLLFFAMFLPLGEVYSIDAAFFNKKRRFRRSYIHLSVATLAIGLQLSWMYITSWYHKTGKEWRESGEATWLALQLDFFRTTIGDMMLYFPNVLKLLTFSVLWWEGYGAYFWYCPLLTGPLRTLGTIGYSFMHVGFSAALRLGQFGCAGTFGVMIMFPSWFWENVVFRRLRTKERTDFKLYYNSNCSFCTRLATVFEYFFLIPETQVIPMDGEAEEEVRKWDEKSVVVDIKPGRTFSWNETAWLVAQDSQGVYHHNFNAFLAICRVSPLLWPMFYMFRNQQWAARTFETVIKLPTHSDKRTVRPQVASARSENIILLRKSFKLAKLLLLNIACLVFLIYVFTWNAPYMSLPSWATPPKIRFAAYALHLDQSWAMFSPRPPNVEWSYIIQAELDNGTEVELFREEGLFSWEPNPFSWTKPDPFWRSFKNHRWFKYFENGFNTHPNNDVLRLNFGRYICREFNSRHSGPAQLYKFSIHWMPERVDPERPNDRFAMPKQTLWNHVCYDKRN